MEIDLSKQNHVRIHPLALDNEDCPPVHIIQIGAGGTGGYVASQLLRLLGGHPRREDIIYTLMDGDTFESKNIGRQLCFSRDLGQNKADNIIRKYGVAFGVPHAQALHKYLTSASELYQLIRNTPNNGNHNRQAMLAYDYLPVVIIIDCVDKNTPRRYIYDAINRRTGEYHGDFNSGETGSVVSQHTYLISSGNGPYSGQVFWGRVVDSWPVFTRRSTYGEANTVKNVQDIWNGAIDPMRTARIAKDMLYADEKETAASIIARFQETLYSVPLPYTLFPNLIDISHDKAEEELSCADRAAANVQHIVANQTAANLVVNYVTAILRGLFPQSPDDQQPLDCIGVHFNAANNTFRTRNFND